MENEHGMVHDSPDKAAELLLPMRNCLNISLIEKMKIQKETSSISCNNQ